MRGRLWRAGTSTAVSVFGSNESSRGTCKSHGGDGGHDGPPATLSFQNRDIAEFPAYESDPEEGPKIVPREKWFAAPAAPD
jgi:hypothetical protein